ncbi:LacI family DNA-binding transcriptional regulator [Nocardioides sp. KR10-350]|uniref:LacI family DNA-binding transcriptional regulator n=1 Tax=Nocardioides cheoyonin TaxID=3156615 RepID=UPI0032B5AACF
MNKITIRDLAEHAGVSVGTVSRVLNDQDNVAAELRARVLLAVKETGYERLRARAARPRAAREEITFFVALREVDEDRPSLDYFWAGILHGAEQRARRSGARVSYRALHGLDHGTTVSEQLGGDIPERALLVGPAPASAVTELRALGVSLVLVDNAVEGQALPTVNSDNFGGSLAVMEHLIGLGHTRIAYVGGPLAEDLPDADAIHSVGLRTAAYHYALERRRIAADPALVTHCDLTPDGASAAVQALVDDGRAFTAVFCANDPAATGAVRGLRERGLRVPDDVSVAGFDDQFGDHVDPRLTTVRVNRAALGALAVDALADLGRSSEPPSSRVVSVELVVGRSTAAPGAGSTALSAASPSDHRIITKES